jgi:hypothetical protein
MLSLYPNRNFEAEVEREDGAKLYVNIGLPLSDGKKLNGLYEDNWWAYTKPLHEIDFEDVDKDYAWDDGLEYIALELTNRWNENPVYKETEGAWEGAWDNDSVSDGN